MSYIFLPKNVPVSKKEVTSHSGNGAALNWEEAKFNKELVILMKVKAPPLGSTNNPDDLRDKHPMCRYIRLVNSLPVFS